MKVELFHAVGCSRCADGREALRSAAVDAVPDLVWREIDVTKDLDYAVQVGVLGLPALAVDGELVFPSLPTAGQLVAELRRRAQGHVDGR